MVDNKLLELVKSAAINFFGALVMALFIFGGTYLLVIYAGMEQIAAAGLITLLATQVFSALPASAKGLATAFVEYLKTAIPIEKPKNDDEGSSTPTVLLAVGLVMVVVVAIILGAIYVFNVDVVAVMAGAAAMAAAFLGWTGLVKPAKSWPGVTIARDPERDADVAYINWTDFDKSRIKVLAAPVGTLGVRFAYKNQSWFDPQCRWDDVAGILYSLVSDPVKDNVHDSDMAVWNEMQSWKTGADQLVYIVEKWADNGGDAKYLKALLCVGRQELENMQSGKAGPTAYADFVNDVNPSPYNLTAYWQTHLTHPDISLRSEADYVYYDFYKKA